MAASPSSIAWVNSSRSGSVAIVRETMDVRDSESLYVSFIRYIKVLAKSLCLLRVK